MVLYYRGSDVVVTHEVFAVLGPYPQRFPLAELDNVRVAPSEVHPVRAFSTYSAGASAVVAATAWPLLDSLTAWLTAVVVVVGLLVVSLACRRLAPRTYELRAVYQGTDLLLYRSSNSTAFGAVRRGLNRALEDLGSRSNEVWAPGFIRTEM